VEREWEIGLAEIEEMKFQPRELCVSRISTAGGINYRTKIAHVSINLGNSIIDRFFYPS